MSAERLREMGTEDERRLLARAVSEAVVVPDRVRRQVLRGMDARLTRRRPTLLVMAALLVAGSALAAGLMRPRRPEPPRAPAIAPAPTREVRPEPQRPPPPRRHASPRPRPRALLSPDWDPRPPALDENVDPTPPSPRLVIAREAEPEVALVLAANRVVGTVRGTTVALALEGGRLTGKVGTGNVWLWLHGHEAQGEIGGIPVRFELIEVQGGQELREGYSVRAALPPGATRVALVDRSLRWSPGCDAALPEVASGTYEGTCASGRRARVVVPEAWSRLPPLAGAILLSFFLTERDPSFLRLFAE